jgi:hypothetical protein
MPRSAYAEERAFSHASSEVRLVKQRAATAVFVGILLSLTACGGVDATRTVNQGSATGTLSDEEEIQQLYAKWMSALKARNYEEVCAVNTQEFNDELIAGVREAFGPVTCEMAVRVVTDPQSDTSASTLRDIEISGATAKGRVGRSPSWWRFARVGGAWKVAYAN